MRYLSVDEMREADRRCIEELGIPGVVLMHNAGAAIYDTLPKGSLVIVCGKGNNGGDGFVVARLALLDGRAVRVVLLAEPDALTHDAKIFHDAYCRLGGEVVSVTGDAVAGAVSSLSDCDVLLDAMLGTGIQGEVRGDARTAIDHWPDVTTVAVDIPSGLDADAGTVSGNAIRADVTVTIQFAKKGFANPDAAEYFGEVVIADIGIPEVCADDDAWEALRRSW